MESGLYLVGYLVVVFAVFLYLPHASFKIGARAQQVDLDRRRDVGEFEDLLSAALPSSVLHIFTFIWFFILRWFFVFIRSYGFRRIFESPILDLKTIPVPDYSVISAIVVGERNPVSDFINVPGSRAQLYKYLIVLVIVSLANGFLYGVAIRRSTRD